CPIRRRRRWRGRPGRRANQRRGVPARAGRREAARGTPRRPGTRDRRPVPPGSARGTRGLRRRAGAARAPGGGARLMFVVATAGHVDHGKSTLVRALTGEEPDRWDEERRRGLTIDLGYAATTLDDGRTVAF